jgi:hypothetical protein
MTTRSSMVKRGKFDLRERHWPTQPSDSLPLEGRVIIRNSWVMTRPLASAVLAASLRPGVQQGPVRG